MEDGRPIVNIAPRTSVILCFAAILALQCTLAWIPTTAVNHYRARTLIYSDRASTSFLFAEDVSTILLRVSYDGRHFTGWSSANEHLNQTSHPSVVELCQSSTKRTRRRKSRTSQRPSGFVRSVRGVLQTNLAKLYGNIDPRLVLVEGCSRTDKGVHATALVAQIHCQDPKRDAANKTQLLPLPKSPHDIAFCLNRMCTDIKITAVAPVPFLGDSQRSFHPSTSVLSKTYCYTLAVGPLCDPTALLTSWYVGRMMGDDDGGGGGELFHRRIEEAADLLAGCHDFRAFRGAPRSSRDAVLFSKQDTICTIQGITVAPISTWQGTTTYQIRVTGDRFLYKMVRWIVGALVAVGLGEVDLQRVQTALQEQQRPDGRWQCAPAHGLVLEDVEYPFPIEWDLTSM